MTGSFLKVYAGAVSEQLDFLATFPLGYDVQQGDVGILSGHHFKRTDTLERLDFWWF